MYCRKSISIAYAIVLIFVLFFSQQSANSASSQLNKGIEALQKADYARAVEAFDKILTKEPGNYSAHLYKAVALNYAGKIDEAEREYTWLIHNAPNPESRKQAQHALNAIEEIKKQQSMFMNSQPPGNINKSNDAAQVNTNKSATKPQILCFVDTFDVNSKPVINFIDSIKKQYDKFIDFDIIDITNPKSSDLTAKYQIRGVVPTVVLLDKDGQTVDKMVHDINYDNLKTKINLLSSN